MKLNNDSNRNVLGKSGIHLHLPMNNVFGFAVQVVLLYKVTMVPERTFLMKAPFFFFIPSPNIISGKDLDCLNLADN
jgi:hypothetical protein